MSTTDTNNPVLVDCIVLGANGFPFAIGSKINVSFEEGNVHCIHAARTATFGIFELAELQIAGPGSVTTGGGFIGGGFGVDGALEGVAIATLLNFITTKTKVHTFLTLITNFGELHLHYSGMEPSALRMALAPVYVKIRRIDAAWQESRMKVLQEQHVKGHISSDDLSRATRRLQVESDWKDPAIEAAELSNWKKDSLENGPKGQCPNCESIIPLYSESCSKCKAAFGVGSAWKVIPV
jgi:hypothetical protein